MGSRSGVLTLGLGALTAILTWATHARVVAEHLDLTTFWCVLSAGVAASLTAISRLPRRTRTGLGLAVTSLAMMLAAGELVFRTWSGSYATYLETNESRSYELQYHHTSPARYHVFSPNVSYTTPRQEFAFPRTTNSLGLPERELPVEKAGGEFRIMALGDSYTEGMGTSYDETWLKVVERRAAAAMPDCRVTSFNAGVSGSDPWYELVLLEDKLLVYAPDVVFVAINASDVNDVIIRGGAERFGADGVTRPRPTPWWEWIYGVSFLARHVVHDVLGYNSLFIKTSRWQDARRDAGQHLLAAVERFRRLSHERGFRLVVVIHPDKQEAARRRYERGFQVFVDAAEALPDLDVVDVLARWKASGMLDRAGSLYWPIDGHNTAAGYKALGDVVADHLFARPDAAVASNPIAPH